MFNSLDEIKMAVDNGKKICWKNNHFFVLPVYYMGHKEGYSIQKDDKSHIISLADFENTYKLEDFYELEEVKKKDEKRKHSLANKI